MKIIDDKSNILLIYPLLNYYNKGLSTKNGNINNKKMALMIEKILILVDIFIIL